MYAMTSQSVTIGTSDVVLAGDLTLHPRARGLVLFAHGSGSSRHSPRNRHVAEVLVGYGFATLLMDLLTAWEDARDRETAEYRFDITLLAERLEGATAWARGCADTRNMDIGYFGASTGAAAAIVAAAIVAASRRTDPIRAIVSRGGRPDLAGVPALGDLSAPTLLIVGDNDPQVLTLNRQAASRMRALHEVAVVPGATHLFEEPGALDQVAALAGEWFGKYLGAGS